MAYNTETPVLQAAYILIWKEADNKQTNAIILPSNRYYEENKKGAEGRTLF
jgi:hypothetical protein